MLQDLHQLFLLHEATAISQPTLFSAESLPELPGMPQS